MIMEGLDATKAKFFSPVFSLIFSPVFPLSGCPFAWTLAWTPTWTPAWTPAKRIAYACWQIVVANSFCAPLVKTQRGIMIPRISHPGRVRSTSRDPEAALARRDPRKPRVHRARTRRTGPVYACAPRPRLLLAAGTRALVLYAHPVQPSRRICSRICRIPGSAMSRRGPCCVNMGSGSLSTLR